ncbi:hypothetical protein R6Q59_002685 [Mikania micrantha]|uniref:Late embryogenesis abundant protein LEA-2 subgroup domain-containing protein n=1 Tax=Mikania micrantha TaxID=192012 RepID=A0A5N6NQN4_9ASTR|nr:hypothetical protein E3N88_19706 [Mikania micrantha]
MSSEVIPLEIEATEAPPGRPAAETFPASIIWWMIPVFLFLLYVVAARLILNAGDLKVTGGIRDREVSIVAYNTTIIFSATFNISFTVRKKGKIHPVPDTVHYNLTVGTLLARNVLVSTFSSSPFNISKNEMNVRFEPFQTHVTEELVLLLLKQLKDEKVWLLLSLDFQWHVKERKVELEYSTSGFKHSHWACRLPMRGDFTRDCK